MSEELKQLESILDDVCGAGGIMPIDEPIYTISLTEIAEAFRRLKAGQGEAVAWVVETIDPDTRRPERAIDWYRRDIDPLPIGSKLYTSLPASADAVSVPRGLLESAIERIELNTHFPFGEPQTPEDAENRKVTDELRALFAQSQEVKS